VSRWSPTCRCGARPLDRTAYPPTSTCCRPVNRSDDALLLADESVAYARSRGNPFLTALTLLGYGRALGRSDPDSALRLLLEAHQLSRAHPIPQMESLVARDTAGLEARHGDIDRALELLDETIESFHRAGAVVNVAGALANLALLFDRLDRPEIAATLVGITMRQSLGAVLVDRADFTGHLHDRLGHAATEAAIADAAQIDLSDGVRYARDQIATPQHERSECSKP
jgi:hypothetical protein